MPKTIIVTGASRGIGRAVCEHLLKYEDGQNIVAVARTESPLREIESIDPSHVAILVADMKDATSGQAAVNLALERFSQLDGLVVNHGMVEPVQRIADANVEEWRTAFDINVFSVIGLIKASLPSLRRSNGKIILTSSGAAVKGTAAWGCYGAGKAVHNSLARTLAEEEPSIVTIAVRPGVVDTEMQTTLAAQHFPTMDKKDAQKFENMRAEGKMLRPEQPGNVMARLALGADEGFSGQFIEYLTCFDI